MKGIQMGKQEMQKETNRKDNNEIYDFKRK